MKIEVTKEDIKNGKRLECDLCPIALAIKRSDANIESVFVTPRHAYITRRSEGEKNFRLPDQATIFVLQFDQASAVEPFEFELQPEFP